MLAVQKDVANGMQVLVEDRDLVATLHDLKRKRHIGDARDAWQETPGLRIHGMTIPEVLVFLCQRGWQIRNLVSVDDPCTCGDAQLRMMILNIPCGGVQRLPDPLHVGMTVWRARRRICPRLTGGAPRSER